MHFYTHIGLDNLLCYSADLHRQYIPIQIWIQRKGNLSVWFVSLLPEQSEALMHCCKVRVGCDLCGARLSKQSTQFIIDYFPRVSLEGSQAAQSTLKAFAATSFAVTWLSLSRSVQARLCVTQNRGLWRQLSRRSIKCKQTVFAICPSQVQD